MQYFTFELWTKLNSENENEREEADLQFSENGRAYWQRFEKLKVKMSTNVFEFFNTQGFHDYHIKNIEMIHGVYKLKNPIEVVLTVTDAFDTWKLNYNCVNRFEIHYSSSNSSSLSFHNGFDDWGYDELLEVEEETLSHEILFASGATITIHFLNGNISLKKVE